MPSGTADGVILGKQNGGFVGGCWRLFWGWLLGVVYNDSLGVVLGDLLGWFLLISGMILGDILGDSWWFYE